MMPGRRTRSASRTSARSRAPLEQCSTSKARFERCGEVATMRGLRMPTKRMIASRTFSVAVAVSASTGGAPSMRRRSPICRYAGRKS